MSSVSFQNITIDTDTSVILFESLKMLDFNGAIFNNISSYSSDSTNNYMIQIQQTGKFDILLLVLFDIVSVIYFVYLDISGSVPMQIQDLNVHDSTIALIDIGTLVGTPIINNSMTVSDIVISD